MPGSPCSQTPSRPLAAARRPVLPGLAEPTPLPPRRNTCSFAVSAPLSRACLCQRWKPHIPQQKGPFFRAQQPGMNPTLPLALCATLDRAQCLPEPPVLFTRKGCDGAPRRLGTGLCQAGRLSLQPACGQSHWCPHTLRPQCGPAHQVRAPTKALVVFGKMKSPRIIHVIVYTCQLIKLN